MVKQTFEVVDEYMFLEYYDGKAIEDWQTLKKLLGIK